MTFFPRRLLTLFIVLFAAAPCVAQFDTGQHLKSTELTMIQDDARQHRIAAASRFRRDTLRERIEFDTAGRVIFHRDERWSTTYTYDSLGRLVHEQIKGVDPALAEHVDVWRVFDVQGRVTTQKRMIKKGRRAFHVPVLAFRYEGDGRNFRRTTFYDENLAEISDSSVERREVRVLDCFDSSMVITHYDDLWRPIDFEYYEHDRLRLRHTTATYTEGVSRMLDTLFRLDGTVAIVQNVMTDTNLRVQEEQTFMMMDTAEEGDVPPVLRLTTRNITELNEQMRPIRRQLFNDEGTLIHEIRSTCQEQGLLAGTRREYFTAPDEPHTVFDSNVESVVEERWEYDFHPPAPPEKGKIR